MVKEPFAVINADDFYGSNAFENAAAFLKKGCNENVYAIVGYDLQMCIRDSSLNIATAVGVVLWELVRTRINAS